MKIDTKGNIEKNTKNNLLGRCVECEQFIRENDFKDKRNLQVFATSGLCLKCQKIGKNENGT